MSDYYNKPKRSQLSRTFMPYNTPSPNEGYSYEQDETQMTAQSLYRNTTIGKLVVDSYCRFVVGKGLVPMASPETKFLNWTDEQAKEFQEKAEAYWRINSGASLDFYGKNSFVDLEKIAIKDICNNGDTLPHWGYRKLADGRIVPFVQLISGRMVTQNGEQDTKDSIGGVIFKNGRESGYKIRVLGSDWSDTGSTRIVNRYNKFGRLQFNLIQLNQTDPHIVRGIPLLTTLRDDVLNINKFRENHLGQSALQNLFTAFITHKEQPQTSIAEKLKDVSEQLPIGQTDDGSFSLGTGNILDLDVGEEPVFTPRSTQGDDYSAYIKSNIGILASSLGMSYETAMNEFNASFSASRAGISGTENNLNIGRQEFIRKFCQPSWELVIEHGILSGFIPAPGYDGSEMMRNAIFASTWVGVTQQQVDPTKEVKAYVEAINAGLCTREYAIRQLYGMDFDEVEGRINKEMQETNNQESDTDSDTDDDTDTEEEK